MVERLKALRPDPAEQGPRRAELDAAFCAELERIHAREMSLSECIMWAARDPQIRKNRGFLGTGNDDVVSFAHKGNLVNTRIGKDIANLVADPEGLAG